MSLRLHRWLRLEGLLLFCLILCPIPSRVVAGDLKLEPKRRSEIARRLSGCWKADPERQEQLDGRNDRIGLLFFFDDPSVLASIPESLEERLAERPIHLAGRARMWRPGKETIYKARFLLTEKDGKAILLLVTPDRVERVPLSLQTGEGGGADHLLLEPGGPAPTLAFVRRLSPASTPREAVKILQSALQNEVWDVAYRLYSEQAREKLTARTHLAELEPHAKHAWIKGRSNEEVRALPPESYYVAFMSSLRPKAPRFLVGEEEIDGDTATVTLSAWRHPLSFRCVREDGGWKVDTAPTRVDPEQIVEEARRRLYSPPETLRDFLVRVEWSLVAPLEDEKTYRVAKEWEVLWRAPGRFATRTDGSVKPGASPELFPMLWEMHPEARMLAHRVGDLVRVTIAGPMDDRQISWLSSDYRLLRRDVRIPINEDVMVFWREFQWMERERGLLLKSSQKEMPGKTGSHWNTEWTYDRVNGFLLPVRIREEAYSKHYGGTSTDTWKLTDYRINIGLDPEDFKKKKR